ALAGPPARPLCPGAAHRPDRRAALDLHGAADDRRNLSAPGRLGHMSARASLLLLLAVAAAFAASVLLPFDSLQVLFAEDRGLAMALLVELRLPRALLALAYGATLGAAGAAVQAL